MVLGFGFFFFCENFLFCEPIFDFFFSLFLFIVSFFNFFSIFFSFARMVLCDLYEQIAGEFQVVDVSVELEQQQRLSEEAQKSESGGNGSGSDGGLHSSVHKNVLKRLEKMGQRIKTLAKTMTLIEQVRCSSACCFFYLYCPSLFFSFRCVAHSVFFF